LETPVYVGNKLKEIDFLKFNYRSPFERNIVQHSGLLENLNDYIFNELGEEKLIFYNILDDLFFKQESMILRSDIRFLLQNVSPIRNIVGLTQSNNFLNVIMSLQ